VKVNKSSRGNTISRVKASSETGRSSEKEKPFDNVSVEDTVSLSEEALAQSRVDAANQIEATDNGTSGALPDPYETSEKMLEKELKRVFKESYLFGRP
jgi:hypothetical protein